MANPIKLIEIDSNTVFELYNVQDVGEIHKKLQNEIEKKKEDLRTMVGERYRDLIQAADTIGEMKLTSSNVGSHVQNIIDSCVRLNDHQLIGFKSIEQPKSLSNPQNNKYHSTVIQIKLLMILPEAIWSAIDDEKFFTATQLFIFSRHISTGLQLEQNTSILKNLPVARRQWDTLSTFFFTIKKSCFKTLENEDLDSKSASECLASILLLENCQIDKLLSILIQSRGKAFLNCLCDDIKHPKVKDKILLSIKILNETILLIYKCFIDNEVKNLLLLLLEDAVSPNFNLLKSEFESEILEFLPDIISKFRPIVNYGELKNDTIKLSMKMWMENIENVAKNQLKLIVNLITSVRVIHDIQQKVKNHHEIPNNWNIICSSLFLPDNLDLYRFCYQPLILDCIKSIIRNSWKSSLSHTKLDIEKLLDDNKKNLKNFRNEIWLENDNDIPKSLKDALNPKKQCHKLLMKSKGYIPLIVEICDSLDERLEILYQDFSLYLGRNDNKGGLNDKKSNDELKEENDIIEFFKECSREGVTDLITDIKSIKHNDDDNISPTNYILLARILQAISELCPHLKMCLSFNQSTTKWNNNSKQQNINQNEYWDNICSLLDEESLRFWKMWVEKFEILSNNFNADNINMNILLKEFPNWEIQKIEEKDEQENIIESKIRIPSQPSFFLQEYLHKICLELNKLAPNTLPKYVIILITEKIINDFIVYYKKLSENNFIQKNQNAALQYYFDVKFLSLVLVSRENKILSDKIKTLSNNFKSFIDPFDFELFFKYLNDNVRKSGIRMQHQLGCIITNNEQLQVFLGGIGGGNQGQDREPNILALSSTANTTPWFPLLPIVNTNSGDSSGGAQQKIDNTSDKGSTSKSSKKLNDNQRNSTTLNYAQNVKTGAAAFFGAMSQDWFR